MHGSPVATHGDWGIGHAISACITLLNERRPTKRSKTGSYANAYDKHMLKAVVCSDTDRHEVAHLADAAL